MMASGDPHQHQQHQHPPLPQQQFQQQHQQQHQQHFGEFPRGPQPPPGPPPMMRQPSASSTTLNTQPPGPPPHPSYEAHADSFAAKRMRKIGQRKAVDYTSTVVRYMQIRMWQRDSRDRTVLQPSPAAAVDILPAVAYLDNPSTSFAAKFVHTSLNKNRCSINCVVWTPSGRRLITGSQSGEFTLWNGQSFNFEMILQAHDQAVRSMVWSHNDNWMVTGDDGGTIKYWQTNMNNVKANKNAHKESIRELSFCSTDLKFCSCSDDTTVKVWDFARCQEERSLSGHGWDVKSVDWHPTKSLLVSGGKDNLVKLWDAKSGKELSSFHGHKNTVLCVKWNQNGNWVLTASKDQIIKLYDIRAMKELESFRGHQKDVTSLAWHPFHEEYFVSGSYDGSIFHWLVGHEAPQVEITNAHETGVWDLAWHPIGYLLCSGSNDQTTKFWCRNRPGDSARDKFNLGQQGLGEQNNVLGRMPGNFPGPEPPSTPGAFASGMLRNEGTIPGVGAAMPLSIPSLDSSSQEQKTSMPVGAPPLPPGPHPSLLASNQQQAYQQNMQQPQQPQSLPQQMTSLPLQPSNLPQLQPPHMPLMPHPHLPRPPHQLQPVNMPGLQSSMPGSGPIQGMPIPGPMGIQGNMNQMGPPMPQGHFVGMPSGSGPQGNVPPGGMPNGLPNMQGPQNPGGNQMFPPGRGFNRQQAGQMPLMPGLNPYQSQSEKPWMNQLAAVTCLSLAAKIEETQVPLLLDLQVEESRYLFEPRTIQRVELLILSTLKWKMNPVTPFSFLDYFSRRLGLNDHICFELLKRCERVLLSTITDCRFMCHLPSAMAAATMLYVIDKLEPCIGEDYHEQLLGILGIVKDNVTDCCKLVQEVASNIDFNSNKRKFGALPGSPIGVMDVSFSSDSSNDSWAVAASVSSSPEPLSKKTRTHEKEK